MATTLTKSDVLADEGKFQQACGLWVARNIGWCVSSLMYDVGQNLEECSRIFDFDYDEAMGWFRREDWQEPVEQLIADADLDDLEDIAERVGWWSDVVGEFPTATKQEDEDGEVFWRADGDRFDDEDEANQDVLERNIDKIREKVSALITNDEEYRDIVNAYNLEPDTWEIYEHWILKERWTARELEAHGEIVFDFGELSIWGRCTTGQSIAIDGVVRDIVRDYHEDHWIWGEVR